MELIDDVLGYIFNMLEIDDLCRSRRICKQWNKIIQQKFSTYRKISDKFPKQIEYLHIFPNLKKIKLWNTLENIASYKNLLCQFHSLRKLTIPRILPALAESESDMDLFSENDPKIEPSVAHIPVVHYDNCTILSGKKFFYSAFIFLEDYDGNYFIFSSLEEINDCVNIRKVHISAYKSGAIIIILEKLISNNKKIQTLRISLLGNEIRTSLSLISSELISQLPELRKLVFSPNSLLQSNVCLPGLQKYRIDSDYIPINNIDTMTELVECRIKTSSMEPILKKLSTKKLRKLSTTADAIYNSGLDISAIENWYISSVPAFKFGSRNENTQYILEYMHQKIMMRAKNVTISLNYYISKNKLSSEEEKWKSDICNFIATLFSELEHSKLQKLKIVAQHIDFDFFLSCIQKYINLFLVLNLKQITLEMYCDTVSIIVPDVFKQNFSLHVCYRNESFSGKYRYVKKIILMRKTIKTIQ